MPVDYMTLPIDEGGAYSSATPFRLNAAVDYCSFGRDRGTYWFWTSNMKVISVCINLLIK